MINYKIFGLGVSSVDDVKYIKITLVNLSNKRTVTVKFDIPDDVNESKVMILLSAHLNCDIYNISMASHIDFNDVGISP